MLNKQYINWIKWIDGVNLSTEDIKKVLEKHKIHELDLKACLEWNQRIRLDKYNDYIFIVFHFPKYSKSGQIYKQNEFNIFLSEKFLITFRDFSFSRINQIFKQYSTLETTSNIQQLKITTPYILYKIIQSMIEKAFNMLKNIKLDIRELEKKAFEEWNTSFVKDIMIKKRNIVLLKHIFRPQVTVLKQLQDIINTMYTNEIKAYFEELEDKINQIIRGCKEIS